MKTLQINRIALLLVAVLSMAGTVQVLADHVTPELAEQSARAFLNSRNLGGQSHNLRMARRQPMTQVPAADNIAYYVFNIGEDAGFIMVSGDDRAPAILGYTDSGTFESSQLPAHIRAWFDGYAEQLSYLEQTEGRYEAPRLAINRAAVSPMLTTRWSQSSPYNDACPIDTETGKRSVAGCGAIAMAQVLYYHKYPEQTLTTIPAYTTKSHHISMSAINVTPIEWDLMRDSYSEFANSPQKEAVATLVKLCGQSVKMDYTSSGSAAATMDIVNALQTYFGYDPSVQLINRNHFDANEWESLIYAELTAGRPVIYSGQSEGGGHGFVVDGYDGNGLFHINWGWGGKSDGYFRLSVLNPNNTDGIGASSTTDGFSFHQDAIVGIQHGISEVDNERLTVYTINATNGTSFSRSNTSSNFTNVKVKATCYNISGMTNTFTFGYALYDSNNNMVGGNPLTESNTMSLNTYQGFETNSTLSFGAGLANGTYWIVPMSYTDSIAGWKPCYGADVFRLKADISDKTLTLVEPSVSLTATLQATGTCEVGQALPMKATITNSGSTFNDDVYIFVGNERSGGRALTIEGGATVDLEFDFIPKSTGAQTVKLAYLENNQYVYFAETSVNVASASSKSLATTINVTNLTNGKLTSNHASVDIAISNNGPNAYDQPVLAYLLKEGDSNSFSPVIEVRQDLSLQAGANKTIHCDFYDVPTGGRAIVALFYLSAGTWTMASSYSQMFEVTYTGQPHLVTKSLTLEGGDEGNVLQEPIAKISAVISNNGDANASDVPIAIQLYKRNANNGNYDKVKEEVQTKDVWQGGHGYMDVTFVNLEAGASYKALVAYASGNNTYAADNSVPLNFSIAPLPPASGPLHIPQIDNLTITVTRGDTQLADGDLVTVGDQLTITYTTESPYYLKNYDSNQLVQTVKLTEADIVSERVAIEVDGESQGFTKVTPSAPYGTNYTSPGWPRTSGWTVKMPTWQYNGSKTLKYTYMGTGPTTISYVQALNSQYSGYGPFKLFCKVNGNVVESSIHDFSGNTIVSDELLLNDEITFNATGYDVVEWVCQKLGTGLWVDNDGRTYYIGDIQRRSPDGYAVKEMEVVIPKGALRISQTDNLEISVTRGDTQLADGDVVTAGDELTITYTAAYPYLIKSNSSRELVETKTLTMADFQDGDLLDHLIDGAAQGFTEVTPESPYRPEGEAPVWPRTTGWFVHMPTYPQGLGSRTLSYIYTGTGQTKISYVQSIDNYYSQWGRFKMYCKVNGEVIGSSIHDYSTGPTVSWQTLLKDTITFNATGNDVIEWICDKVDRGWWADDYGRIYFIGSIKALKPMECNVKDEELILLPVKLHIPQTDQLAITVTRCGKPLAEGDMVNMGDTLDISYKTQFPYLIKSNLSRELEETVTLSDTNLHLWGDLLDPLIDGAAQGFTEATPEAPYRPEGAAPDWPRTSGWYVHMPTYPQGLGSRKLTYVYTGTGPTTISYVQSIDNYYSDWGRFKMYCKVNGKVIESSIRDYSSGPTVSWQTLLHNTITFNATGNDVIEWVCDKVYNGWWADDYGRIYYIGGITVLNSVECNVPDVELAAIPCKLRIPQSDHLAITVTRGGTPLADGDEVNVGETLTITYTAEEGYLIKGKSVSELVETVTLTEDNFKMGADYLIDTLIDGVAQGFTEVTPENPYGAGKTIEGWPLMSGWLGNMPPRGTVTGIKTLSYTYTGTGLTNISFVQNLNSPYIGYGKFKMYCKLNGNIVESTVHDFTVTPFPSYDTLLNDTLTFYATGNDLIEWVCEKLGIGNWEDTNGRTYYIGRINNNAEIFMTPAYEAEEQTGDVDEDGEVDMVDIEAISNISAGIIPDNMDEEDKEKLKARADVNKDGVVNVGDIITILKRMAKPSPNPGGESGK